MYWIVFHFQAQVSSDEANIVGNLQCTKVSAELKSARSVVRITEITATLQDQKWVIIYIDSEFYWCILTGDSQHPSKYQNLFETLDVLNRTLKSLFVCLYLFVKTGTHFSVKWKQRWNFIQISSMFSSHHKMWLWESEVWNSLHCVLVLNLISQEYFQQSSRKILGSWFQFWDLQIHFFVLQSYTYNFDDSCPDCVFQWHQIPIRLICSTDALAKHLRYTFVIWHIKQTFNWTLN